MSPHQNHLAEASLCVQNLDASKQFYRRLFGLHILIEDQAMVALQMPGAAVLVLRRHDDTDAEPDSGTDTGHLRFPIAAATLQDWERHLMMHGVVIETRAIQQDGGVSLFFRDLDHHSLEVATG